MFLVSILVVTIAAACIPLFKRQISLILPSFKLSASYNWLPIVAALLFITAFYIPNIHISNETSTFQQHFVGGGLYTACLFVYFKKLFGWRLPIILAVIVLFSWTSAFGVANELMEFTLTKLNLAQIGSGDTQWDLVANTFGALVGYAALIGLKIETYKP